jgi:single-strand DNA-binding protein
MSNLNKALLIGRLTKDPEMRYTPSGTAVTNFSIATNRWSTGPDGERKEFTDYHNIVAYNAGKRNLAEIVAQYTRKGALVFIEGRIQTRSWEGQDGQKRRTTEIIANDVQFLDSRSGGGGGGTGAGTGTGAGAGDGMARTRAGSQEDIPAPDDTPRDVDPDDIPF